MGRQDHRRAVEENLYELGLLTRDEEAEALERHLFHEDEPPQGLHRQGWKEMAYCFRHGEYYSGNEKCPTCKVQEEDIAVSDFMYPEYDEFFEFNIDGIIN